MSEDYFGYSLRAQNALRDVVRGVLAETAKNGLPGDHHFYLSFTTHAPGVVVSDKVRENNPDEMTIVLQNQFEDLNVMDDHFTVRLSFNQIPETLIVPFSALTRFYDPSVSFGLMFDDFEGDEESLSDDDLETLDMLDALEEDIFVMRTEMQNTGNDRSQGKDKGTVKESEVVDLAAFRKNKDED
ncbi:MAG: SspB family protein [Parvibaculales bacterium]